MSGSETNQKEAENAVVTVGEARGFVVEGEHSRFVITASHCLPHLPPVAAARAGAEQRTYSNCSRRSEIDRQFGRSAYLSIRFLISQFLDGQTAKHFSTRPKPMNL
jgi:hypothetical protein